MPLTKSQIDRYDRNIKLENFGKSGQEKLLNSRALVIGAGGLGSPAIYYLAAAGVGALGIADGDIVDASNLQRQILHTVSDIGKLKTASAKEKIERLNPDVKVAEYPQAVNRNNIEAIICDYDFILDCTDDLRSKFLINDACVLLKKPFCHCGVLGFSGRILTFVPGHACVRCAFEEPIRSATPTARDVGILGATVGTLGAMQAGEAIKYLSGSGKPFKDFVLHIDLLKGSNKRITVKRDKKCPVCGINPTITCF
ncbi:MAG: HesA/MoeB/ThiF family protein [Anaerolineales bacterium]|nr:HesA/MoeB/ThiF family protein [Anaerolineales bacterium]